MQRNEIVRILVDTNILISAIFFPNSKVAKTLLYVANFHSMVLCDQNIRELREVIQRKRPEKLADIEVFLAELSFELIPAVYFVEKLIRDAKDQPILNAAIVSGVDLILTGDKDFLSLNIEQPRCLSVSQFLSEYSISIE